MVDRRTERTRSAIETSFNQIFLAEGYEQATPARVAEAAQVGRSTFYEHFGGRDALLEARLSRVLLPLAETVCADAVPVGLEPILDHFWSNRVIVRRLLDGRGRMVTVRALAGLVQHEVPDERPTPAVPLRLITAQIAGGHLALLDAWLSGRHRCSSADLAQALTASARAIIAAYGLAAARKG